jgi:general secretion pathway protein F
MPQLLPTRLRADLFTQLAAMEQAGLPPDKAWGLLSLPRQFQPRVEPVKNALRRGRNLATAAQASGLFSTLEAHLVRAALIAGSPAQTYRRLAQRCAQSATNEGKMRSGLVLPVAMLVVTSVVGPIPQWVTGTLTSADYLWQVLKPIGSVIALGYAAKSLLARPEADAWRLKIPTLGRAIARGQARNFFESLGLLLEAGLPMFEALLIAASMVASHSMRGVYARLLPQLQQGATLSAALQVAAFTPLILGNP